MSRIITYRLLKKHNACSADLFKKLFPNGSPPTVEEAVKAAREVVSKFDWDWAARHLLSPAALEAYRAVKEEAWEAYEAAIRPAWEAVKEEAWEAYEAAKAEAWEAVKEEAWEAYRAAKAEAFARAYFMD